MGAKTPYWVGFHLVKGIGPARFRRLLAHFGDLEAAWHAHPQDLLAAGLPAEVTRRIARVRKQIDPGALLAQWERRGIRVLTWEDPAYPQRLRHIPQSPPVLYLRGALQPEDDWAVASGGFEFSAGSPESSAISIRMRMGLPAIAEAVRCRRPSTSGRSQ